MNDTPKLDKAAYGGSPGMACSASDAEGQAPPTSLTEIIVNGMISRLRRVADEMEECGEALQLLENYVPAAGSFQRGSEMKGAADMARQWASEIRKQNDQGEGQPPAKKTMNTSKDSTGGCCPPPSCSSWLPITDAPNSLAQIIVTDSSSAWVDQKLGVQGDETAGAYYFNGHEDWEDVTHWMPLPSLPNETSPSTGANGNDHE